MQIESIPIIEIKLKRECKTCKGAFYVYKSSLEKSNSSGNFCCRICYNTYLKTRTGEKHNRYNKIDLECNQCLKPIKVIPAKIKEYPTHFCSKKCKFDYHSENYSGANNPSWKGGHIERRGNFNSVKRNNFKFPQFCALCGTSKNTHIHHIIPFRFTQDNSLNNLIPLCVKHHRLIEVLTYRIKDTGVDFKYIGLFINNILRQKQMETFTILRGIQCQIN